jgi:hypothetical protein
LALLRRELARVDGLIGTAGEAGELGDCILGLHRVERPLRLLEGRLLRDLGASGGVVALGFANLAELVERCLGLSERTTRARLAEVYLFDDEPLLARAYAEGRIGVGAAFLIRRVMLARTLPAWIRRAERVTHLQLAREVRFLGHLWECAPDLAARFPGPLPMPELAEALRGTMGTRDPARDPRGFAELRARLDEFALGESRQMLAAGREERRTTISFWAPADVLLAWKHALDRIRARWGPIPAWAAAVLLIEHAVREWVRVDPARRPRETPILERDEYRCQAPGCSSRRNLEVHHIVFRSRGGDDDPANRITLCHAHHRRGVHEGTLRVRGRAPGDLTWRLGSLWFRGNLRVDQLGDPLDHHLHADRGQDEPHQPADHGQPVLAQESHEPLRR